MRMLFLLKRLKTQMQGGNKELTKMAQTFSELGEWRFLSCGEDSKVLYVLVGFRREGWVQRGRLGLVGHRFYEPSLSVPVVNKNIWVRFLSTWRCAITGKLGNYGN